MGSSSIVLANVVAIELTGDVSTHQHTVKLTLNGGFEVLVRALGVLIEPADDDSLLVRVAYSNENLIGE